MKSFSISLYNSKSIQSKYESAFAGCSGGSQRPAAAFPKAPKILKEETIVSKHVKFFDKHPHVKLVLESKTGKCRNTSKQSHAHGQVQLYSHNALSLIKRPGKKAIRGERPNTFPFKADYVQLHKTGPSEDKTGLEAKSSKPLTQFSSRLLTRFVSSLPWRS